MFGLVGSNGGQVAVKSRVVTSGCELLYGEVGKTLLVKGSLDVLKRERVVENVCVRGPPLLASGDGVGECKTGGGDRSDG